MYLVVKALNPDELTPSLHRHYSRFYGKFAALLRVSPPQFDFIADYTGSIDCFPSSL
jgi:hypothetical protein